MLSSDMSVASSAKESQCVLVRGPKGKSAAKHVKIQYSVILPTYNERENIPLVMCMLINTFRRTGDSYEILVVDDNSPDGTAEAVMLLQRLLPEEPLLLLRRPGKLGLGSAYMDGLKYTSGSFVFIMDADLSHHPKFIPDFIAEQQSRNWDIVSGTRYALGGGVCGWDIKRILLSRIANHFAKLMLNPPASDLTGSYRLYKRAALENIISRMESKGYVFQMEMIVRANAMGYSVGEVPIKFVDRIYGISKLGSMEIFLWIKGLLKLFWTI